MSFCPNMRLIMVKEWHNVPLNLDVLRVRCKQWSCPYCCVVNGKEWKKYLLARLNNHDFKDRHWALITLTANENEHKRSPIHTLINLQLVWRKMRHRIIRYNGGQFDYVRVFEPHPNGKYGGYHMHIIADLGDVYERKKAEFAKVLHRETHARRLGLKPRKRLKRERHPARWIKDTCRECRGGFIADFRPLKGGSVQAIRYTAKYVTKQLGLSEFPKHMRRIQTSRAIGSPRKKGGAKIAQWRARAAIFREDLRVYQKIYDVTIKRQVTIEQDFSNGEIWYPPELE